MADVNRLMKQFEDTRKMMKAVAGGNMKMPKLPGRASADKRNEYFANYFIPPSVRAPNQRGFPYDIYHIIDPLPGKSGILCNHAPAAKRRFTHALRNRCQLIIGQAECRTNPERLRP